MKPYFFLGIALLAGCKSVTPSYLKAAAPASLLPGWKPAICAPGGFSVGLPPGWQVVEMNEPSGGSALPNIVPSRSTLFKELSPNADSSQGLFAMLLDTSGGGALKFGMAVFAHESGKKVLNADEEVDEIEGRLKENDMMSTVTREEVTLPIGRAVRVKGVGRSLGVGSLSITCYVLVDGTDKYVSMFAGMSEDAIIAPTKEVMRTFRVLHSHK